MDSSFIIKVLAMLGMLSPASRGALMTAAIFIFVLMGYIVSVLISRFLLDIFDPLMIFFSEQSLIVNPAL